MKSFLPRRVKGLGIFGTYFRVFLKFKILSGYICLNVLILTTTHYKPPTTINAHYLLPPPPPPLPHGCRFSILAWILEFAAFDQFSLTKKSFAALFGHLCFWMTCFLIWNFKYFRCIIFWTLLPCLLLRTVLLFSSIFNRPNCIPNPFLYFENIIVFYRVFLVCLINLANEKL